MRKKVASGFPAFFHQRKLFNKREQIVFRLSDKHSVEKIAERRRICNAAAASEHNRVALASVAGEKGNATCFKHRKNARDAKLIAD